MGFTIVQMTLVPIGYLGGVFGPRGVDLIYSGRPIGHNLHCLGSDLNSGQVDISGSFGVQNVECFNRP